MKIASKAMNLEFGVSVKKMKNRFLLFIFSQRDIVMSHMKPFVT